MKLSIASLVALLALPAFAVAQDNQQVSPETAARIVRLIEDSGHRYSKVNSATWSVTFRGQHDNTVDVLVLCSKDSVYFLSVIADRNQIDENAAALRQLLTVNAQLPDSISLMRDGDNDYVVQSRHMLKQLNGTSFKKAVDAIAGAADDAYGGIKALIDVPTKPEAEMSDIPVGGSFSTPPRATSSVDVLNGRFAVFFDPGKWKETKSDENGRKNFQHVDGDSWASIIFERSEISIDMLQEIALKNARGLAPDVKVIEQERRSVNGTDVRLMRFEGNARGFKFTFYGYYYGGPQGTVQLVTWTGQNIFEDVKPDLEAFLNGLRVTR
jgi:hypothetical protein